MYQSANAKFPLRLSVLPSPLLSCFYGQVDKLKVLSESLSSSAAKAEKRISDHRYKSNYFLKHFRLNECYCTLELETLYWFTKISKASMLLPAPKSMVFSFTVPTTLMSCAWLLTLVIVNQLSQSPGVLVG
jgi:hypothetical protein